METKCTRDLLDSIKTLYDGGKYSDLTVKSSERTYRVHKAIVCPRSEFFAKACDGCFEEAGTGIVSLPEEDPHAVEVEALVSIHDDSGIRPGRKKKKKKEKSSRDCKAGAEKPSALPPRLFTTSPPLGLALHARVFALAEMHGVLGLQDLALLKFRQEANTHWEADEFLLAAEIAYIGTVEQVRELREAVLERPPEV